MTARTPWCSHDTAAIYGGICECGARVHAFASARELAAYLRREHGCPDAARLANVAEGEQQTVDLGADTGHQDMRVIARVAGWFLLLPARGDDTVNRA